MVARLSCVEDWHGCQRSPAVRRGFLIAESAHVGRPVDCAESLGGMRGAERCADVDGSPGCHIGFPAGDLGWPSRRDALHQGLVGALSGLRDRPVGDHKRYMRTRRSSPRDALEGPLGASRDQRSRCRIVACARRPSRVFNSALSESAAPGWGADGPGGLETACSLRAPGLGVETAWVMLRRARRRNAGLAACRRWRPGPGEMT